MTGRRWVTVAGLVLFVVGAVGLAVTVLRPLSVDVTVQSYSVHVGATTGADPPMVTRSIACGFPLGKGPKNATVENFYLYRDPCAHAISQRRALAGGFAAVMILGPAAAALIDRRRKSDPTPSPT